MTRTVNSIENGGKAHAQINHREAGMGDPKRHEKQEKYVVEHIGLDRLAVAEENCRKDVDQPDESSTIRDLADNIREHGLLHPLQVRKALSDHSGREGAYVILAGQRRFLAVRSLGWESVLCRVLDVTPQEAEEISLVENLQRAHLSHADKVRAFAKLNTHYGGDVVKICKAVSLAPATVRNYINASKLPDAVLARLDADKKEERLSLASAGLLSALRGDPRLGPLAGALPRVGTNVAQKEAIERAVKNRTLTVEQIISTHAAEKTRKAGLLSLRTAPQPSNPTVVGVRAPEASEVEKHKSSMDSSAPRAAAETPWIWDEKGQRLVVPQSLYAGVLSFVRENITSPASIGGKSAAGPSEKKRATDAKPRI